MKKLLRIVCIVTLVATLLLLCCCKGTPSVGTVTVYVGDNKYSVDMTKAGLTSDNSVADVLRYLNTQYAVTYELAYGGTFVASIGTLVPNNGSNEYVALFTSDTATMDVSAWALPPLVLDGTTVYCSGVGITDVKLSDGLVVAFVMETY